MGVSEKIYCAFCRLERRVYTKKNATWTNVLLAFLCSAVIMFICWDGFDPRAVIIFVILLAFSDVFIRLRWRMALACPHCGFDPLLYKRDPDETVRRVKARLDQVRSSEKYFFKSQNPISNLPVVHAPSDAKISTPHAAPNDA